MLGRKAARDGETLRANGDRLRLRAWAGDSQTGLLILLTPGVEVADNTVAAAIETAHTHRYRRLRTSALSRLESGPFLRAGFKPCQQLALLTRPINGAVRNGGAHIRKARRRDHDAVLAIDRSAFNPFWQLDHAGLIDALRATPFRHFRIAHGAGGSGITGYAISGRSGSVGYLQRLAISPDEQGQGYGAALVDDSLAWMARWGVAQVWVNTPKQNDGALRLYERLGFEPVSPGLQVLELDLAG